MTRLGEKERQELIEAEIIVYSAMSLCRGMSYLKPSEKGSEMYEESSYGAFRLMEIALDKVHDVMTDLTMMKWD